MRPASLKHLDSKPIKLAGKIFAYPFIVFWFVGLVLGIWKGWREPHLQFCIIMIMYFTVVTVLSILLNVGSRFRLPMMPFIAVLAAYGWYTWWKEFKKSKVSS